jgi:hypothetical protein
VDYDTKFTDNGQLLFVPKNLDPTKSLDEQIKVYGTPGQFNKPTSGGTNDTSDYNYERVIRGIGNIDDLTPTDRTSVENRIYKDGFYEEIAPDWFKKQAEQTLRQSFTPEKLKQLWDEYRNPIIERVKSAGSNSSNSGEGLDFNNF